MFIRKGGLGRDLAGLFLALAWILAAGGCSKPTETATPAAQSATAPGTPTAAAAQNPRNVLVARTKYDTISVQDLTYYARTNLCTPMRDLVKTSMTTPIKTRDQILPVINWIASREAAEAEVKAKNDPELNNFVTAGLQKNLDRMMFLHTYQSEIKDRVTSPTQEDIKAYYDKNRTFYYQPYSFTIRMLLLTTYEPYVVQAGDVPDKLEAIAAQVNGDPQAASQIRADLPGRPLRREPDKMFKPLYTGEKLLVPMNKQRMQEVRSRLEAILKDIKPTSDSQALDRQFADLARQYDESGLQGNITTPLPTGTKQAKPPLTEITQAVNTTAVGQISKIFQTKHGFQVVKVMDRVASGPLPLTHPLVRADILSRLTEERVGRANADLIGTLMDNPSLKVDYRLIATGSQLTTDTVVAVLGSAKLVWQDLKAAWESEGQPTEEGRIRRFLSHNPALATILFRDHFRAQIEDPKTDLGRQMQIMRTAYIGSAYVSKAAYDATAKNLTGAKERAKAYYEAHRDDYRSPELLTYETLLWPMNAADAQLKGPDLDRAQAEVLARAREDMAKVKSLDDFRNLKAQLDEKLMSLQIQPPDTTVPIQYKEMTADFQAILKGIPAGQWTAPALIKDKNFVVSFLVKERTPDKTKTFEESIDMVNRDLFNKDIDDALRKTENDLAQQAGVEYLMQEDAAKMITHELPRQQPAEAVAGAGLKQ